MRLQKSIEGGEHVLQKGLSVNISGIPAGPGSVARVVTCAPSCVSSVDDDADDDDDDDADADACDDDHRDDDDVKRISAR